MDYEWAAVIAVIAYYALPGKLLLGWRNMSKDEFQTVSSTAVSLPRYRTCPTSQTQGWVSLRYVPRTPRYDEADTATYKGVPTMKPILAFLALLALAIPARACHVASSYSLVTPSVSQALVYGSYVPPLASVGYLAAPLPLAPAVSYSYGATYAAPFYSAPLASPYYAPAVPLGVGYGASFGYGGLGFGRSAVVVDRGFGFRRGFGLGLGGVDVRVGRVGVSVGRFGFGRGVIVR